MIPGNRELKLGIGMVVTTMPAAGSTNRAAVPALRFAAGGGDVCKCTGLVVALAGAAPTGCASMPVPITAAATLAVLASAAMPGVKGIRPSSGAWLSQDSGPMISRIRPSETFKNARTIPGSNCVPAHAAISVRPSVLLPASLYERAEVITSNTSATATIRPGRGMPSPARPRG